MDKVDGYAIGEHPTVVRFMKGIRNIRPSVPRYKTTWNTDCVTFDDSNLRNLMLKMTMH